MDVTGNPVVVDMQRVSVAGTNGDVRAFLGQPSDNPQYTLLTLWHGRGRDGKLALHTAGLPESTVVSEQGTDGDQSVLSVDGTPDGVLPVDHRYRKFVIRGASLDQVRAAIERPRSPSAHPTASGIQAANFTNSSGNMTTGSHPASKIPTPSATSSSPTARSTEPVPTDPIANTSSRSPRKPLDLLARVRYPRGSDMSFGLVPDGQQVTLTGSQVFGNCGRNESKWHWTGRGGGITTVPPGSPIRLTLDKGEFRFRIYPREGPGTAQTNPRLDVICLCEDPDDLPTDDDARNSH